MANRLRFIRRQRGTNSKRVLKNIKYPNIPLSINDIYAITVEGDRLDLIANQFYKNVDLWWIIATANPDIIRRDSFVLKTGIQIRIPDPNRITTILRSFEKLNR
jgi:phage tail protein X|tara:strand:- start:745 stop:1056 length:312 start_codon:yes stop_codon:yes gene_type:complete